MDTTRSAPRQATPQMGLEQSLQNQQQGGGGLGSKVQLEHRASLEVSSGQTRTALALAFPRAQPVVTPCLEAFIKLPYKRQVCVVCMHRWGPHLHVFSKHTLCSHCTSEAAPMPPPSTPAVGYNRGTSWNYMKQIFNISRPRKFQRSTDRTSHHGLGLFIEGFMEELRFKLSPDGRIGFELAEKARTRPAMAGKHSRMDHLEGRGRGGNL